MAVQRQLSDIFASFVSEVQFRLKRSLYFLVLTQVKGVVDQMFPEIRQMLW